MLKQTEKQAQPEPTEDRNEKTDKGPVFDLKKEPNSYFNQALLETDALSRNNRLRL
jgi:hypothetical protein